MKRHYDVLEVRVNNNQAVYLMDNLTSMSRQQLDLVFGEAEDIPHLSEVHYLSLREKLLDLGWRLVARQSEYPRDTFIVSFELCTIPEHGSHHGFASEIAKLVLEIVKEELMEMGINI